MRGRSSAWLSLACLLLWGCSTSGQTIAENGAPDQTRAERTESERTSAEDRALTISQHSAWMEGCSGRPVDFQQIDDLDIYATALSHTDYDDVVSCLFPIGPIELLSGPTVGTQVTLGFTISTPFYTRSRSVPREEPPGFIYEAVPGRAALIRTPDMIYVVQWNRDHGRYGILRLLHVTGDAFIIRGESAYGRNYLFRASEGLARYLSDGFIEVEDAEDLKFRVERAESSWRPFSFYYDAIIDENGGILDVLPPSGNPTRFQRVCMRSGLFGSCPIVGGNLILA